MMSMYMVIFNDGSVEYITALGHTPVKHGTVTFDKGHGRKVKFVGVHTIEVKGLM